MVEKIIEKTLKKEEIHNLGDFTQFGAYSLFIIILYECMLLPQMGNMTFMMYGGLEPKVTQCGNYSLRYLLKSTDAYREMKSLQNSTNCIPKYESQFGSVTQEVDCFLNNFSIDCFFKLEANYKTEKVTNKVHKN